MIDREEGKANGQQSEREIGAIAGSITATLVGSALEDHEPGTLRVRLSASGLRLPEDGTSRSLEAVDILCRPPQPLFVPEPVWPLQDRDAPACEAYELAVYSDAYPPVAKLTERSGGRPADDEFVELLMNFDEASDWSRSRDRFSVKTP